MKIIPRHYFRIESRYGPADLFKHLSDACAAHRATFEFDWMKRKVELAASDEAAVRAASVQLISGVSSGAGQGQLLAGALAERGGEYTLPIGVLLQTPDVYIEMFSSSLREIGMKDVRSEYEGAGFSVAMTGKAKFMEYEKIVSDFPLPPYLTLHDEGVK